MCFLKEFEMKSILFSILWCASAGSLRGLSKRNPFLEAQLFNCMSTTRSSQRIHSLSGLLNLTWQLTSLPLRCWRGDGDCIFLSSCQELRVALVCTVVKYLSSTTLAIVLETNHFHSQWYPSF